VSALISTLPLPEAPESVALISKLPWMLASSFELEFTHLTKQSESLPKLNLVSSLVL
jgi:hypothetical protein